MGVFVRSPEISNFPFNEVLPLQSIVIELVANNAIEIESLNGFPIQMGERIFSKILESGKLSRNAERFNDRLSIWKCFATAYEKEMMPTANLSKRLIVINEYLEALSCVLPHMKELDLSYCKLGWSHEILGKLSFVQCITKLSLRKNGLSDDSIQKLTLPNRLYEMGLKNIEELDLSGNDRLTDKICKWLCTFKKLKYLNLSGTQITETGLTILETELNLKQCLSYDFKPMKIETTGLGAKALDVWYETLEKQRNRRSQFSAPYRMCRGHKFYSRPRVTNEEEIETPEIALLLKKSDKIPVVQPQNTKVVKKEAVKTEDIENEIFSQYR